MVWQRSRLDQKILSPSPSFDVSVMQRTQQRKWEIMIKKLFRQHIKVQQERIARALTECSVDGLIISSGAPITYFADDQDAPFHATPHFAHWCPERSPFHLVHLRPGQKARLVFFSPNDFWHEAPTLMQSEWADEFEIIRVEDQSTRWQILGNLRNHAFVGPESKEAEEKGLVANPVQLLNYMDWFRAEKTDYELYCLEQASELGAKGHRAVRNAFAQGASEMEAHHIFLTAIAGREEDLPYPSIIGMDEKSAILHYQQKRNTKVPQASVMLIDSGGKYQGYCSDITRTYFKASAPATFKSLLAGMEKLQQELCEQVRVGVSFKELHKTCHLRTGQLLVDTDILRNCTAETAFSLGLTKIFFPHGLGHMLGIQVHDVGGFQSNERGEQVPPCAEFPTLRMRRPLRAREVVTVEPGMYFIPMRLDTVRHNELRSYCNWTLINELLPFGGIRIEDNVVVEAKESRNLTRAFLGNDFAIS